MASTFIRTYTFVDGTIAYGSQVETEIGNIVTVLNNLDTATINWKQVSILHASLVPFVADCSGGSQDIADFKNSNVTKFAISSAGNVTAQGTLTLPATTNQIVLSGPTRTATLSAVQPASSSRIYTFPDAGAAANVCMDQGAYTIVGAWTYSSAVTITPTTNQLVLGTTRTVTISAVQPASSSRTYTMADAGGNDTFAYLALAQTFTGAQTFSSGISTNKINSTFIGVGRNRIINGDMTIDQRNAGAITGGIAASQVYGVDRFSGQGTGSAGVFKLQQTTSTPPTGFTTYTHITVTTQEASPASTSLYIFQHYIEGSIVRDFALGTANAVTFTLSFWVKSNLTGQFSGAFQNSALNRTYPFTYTINSGSTWEQKTVTVVGDTTGTYTTANAVGLALFFDLGSGANYQGTAGSWSAVTKYAVSSSNKLISSTSNTLDITGIQLEIGSTATSFEFVPTPLQLAQCHRYCQKFGGQGTSDYYGQGMCYSTTQAQILLNHFVPMRTAPTGTATGTIGDFKVLNASASAVACNGSVAFTGLNTYLTAVGVTTASGLVAGNATQLLQNVNGTDNFILTADF